MPGNAAGGAYPLGSEVGSMGREGLEQRFRGNYDQGGKENEKERARA